MTAPTMNGSRTLTSNAGSFLAGLGGGGLLSPVKVTSPAVAGAADAWVRLRALRKLVDRKWVTYLGVWQQHRHVVLLPDDEGQRLLHLHDAFWWAVGFADARQRGADILAVRDEPVPETISLDDAARETGENIYSAKYQWRRGKVYRLWLKHKSRYAFRDQVMANLVTWAWAKGHLPEDQIENVPAVVKEWNDIRKLLPHPAGDSQELAKIDLLPEPVIDVDQAPAARRAQALMIADAEGWLDYEGTDVRTYEVGVPAGRGKVVYRVLPAEAVLPYVQGVGDSHSNGHLVTYQTADA